MARKIMIIDDEPDMVTFLKTLCEENGFETESAMDGNEGIEKIKNFIPDLITLDVVMPNRTGIGFYRDLKKDDKLKDIPVLILSGVDAYQQFFGKDYKTMPKPEAFVEKPINKAELLELIKKHIG